MVDYITGYAETDEQKKDWRYAALSMHQQLIRVGFKLKGEKADVHRIDRIMYAAGVVETLLKAYGIDPWKPEEVEAVMGNTTLH